MDETGHTEQAECDEMLRLIDRFAERTLSQDDAQRMRAHLVGCPECTSQYRTAIESAARTGASAREDKERREADVAHARHVRESVEGQRPAKRNTLLRLRTMIMPAFFAFLIFQVFKAQDHGPRFVVEGAIGEVEVTGRRIESYGDNDVILRRGTRCITGANSSARLVQDGSVLEVGADSSVMVLDFDPPRARLEAGELTIEGPCIVETIIGNVHAVGVSARGRVLLEAHGLLVDPEAGVWSFRNADGEELISPGEYRRFEP